MIPACAAYIDIRQYTVGGEIHHTKEALGVIE
jgi:hypothetical protein